MTSQNSGPGPAVSFFLLVFPKPSKRGPAKKKTKQTHSNLWCAWPNPVLRIHLCPEDPTRFLEHLPSSALLHFFVGSTLILASLLEDLDMQKDVTPVSIFR